MRRAKKMRPVMTNGARGDMNVCLFSRARRGTGRKNQADFGADGRREKITDGV